MDKVLLNSCVLISVEGRDPQGLKSADHSGSFYLENGKLTLSCSGILYRKDSHLFALTSGHLFSSFLEKAPGGKLAVMANTTVQTCIEKLSNHGKIEKKWYKSRVICIESIPEVYEATQNALRGYNQASWTNSWPFKRTSTHSNTKNYPSLVALLHIESFQASLESTPACWKSENLIRGQPLSVVSSAYGLMCTDIFQSSLSKGVVSNICKINNKICLFFTDARCLPGSEGGAIFNDNNEIIGMVTVPRRPKDETHAMQLNYAIPSQILYPWMMKVINKHIPHYEGLIYNESIEESLPIEAPNAFSAVVLLRSGVNWASGILLNQQGYILTNAHLFEGRMDSDKCWVRLSEHNMIINHDNDDDIDDDEEQKQKLKWSQCNVLYISKGSFDVALVQIISTIQTKKYIFRKTMMDISKTNKQPQVHVGEDIIVIGHGLFPPTSNMLATVTSGVLSKIIFTPKDNMEKKAIMYQTDAAVHSGCSGGMLLSKNTGQFLGLVSINVIISNQENKSGVIPTLNFAIPFIQLHKFMYFCQGKITITELKEYYDHMNEDILHMWQMQDPRPPKAIEPHLPSFVQELTEQNNKEEIPKYVSKL